MRYLTSLERGRLLAVFHRKENSGSESFPAPGMDGGDRTRIWDLSDSNQGLQTPSTSVVGYIFFLGDIRNSPSFLEDCWSPKCSGCVKMVLNLFLNSCLPWASQFSLGLKWPHKTHLILLLWKSVLLSRRTLIFQKKGDIESAQPHS